MSLRSLFLAGFLCFHSALYAEIVLLAPAQDEVISTISPELRDYLNKSTADRRKDFDNPKIRAALHNARDAQSYPFFWECRDDIGDFVVEVSENEDFSDLTPIITLSTWNEDVRHKADLSNFLVGKNYYWRVICHTIDGQTITSKPSRFSTDPMAPRLLTIPNLGNVRDLGGRQGLEGRSIKQGLIFRSSGLNENSPDFRWDKKQWKKSAPEDFRLGRNRVTHDGIDYINRALRWKTELDLRSKPEVGPMKASPLGSHVRWINNSSSFYSDIFKDDGRKSTAMNFRVFCNRENYPINFHCISGADRTGTLAYLLGGVLGVSADELAKDWETTANNYFNYEEQLDQFVDKLNKFGSPDDPLVKKIEAYLRDIGITDNEIADFRNIMLEPHVGAAMN